MLIVIYYIVTINIVHLKWLKRCWVQFNSPAAPPCVYLVHLQKYSCWITIIPSSTYTKYTYTQRVRSNDEWDEETAARPEMLVGSETVAMKERQDAVLEVAVMKMLLGGVSKEF